MSATVWHEVECGGYAADLPLWEELAERAGGAILDLGCGTGRVSLHLARRGHPVTGLDNDAELTAVLEERAGELPVAVTTGDARDFELADEFALVLVPMQLLQLLLDDRERASCLRCVRDHLEGGGIAALAIVESMPEAVDDAAPMPDAREVDGWVYSSLPLGAALDDGAIAVRRLRQTVSPEGELSEELDEVRLALVTAEQLEAEASTVELMPAGRRAIPATDDHVGSTVVLLEREA
ncbi:MAG TPA: class I SAM-dependent methyltransferase [Solirubrobacterales bacterium]